MYAKAMVEYQEQMEQWELAKEMALQEAGPQGTNPQAISAVPPPPQEPPAPIFLPRQIELKIFGVWSQMIEKKTSAQPDMQPGLPGIATLKAGQTLEDPQAVAGRIEQFLRFRAVVEGYRLLVQKKQQEEMAKAAPGPEAPASGPGPAPGQTPEG